MGRIELTWWCQESWHKKAGESPEWYFSNEKQLGVNEVLNFPPLSMPPQELDISGSMQSFACFFLNSINNAKKRFGLDVSGTGLYANASAWCNHVLLQSITPGSTAIGLLDNIFLVSGNRAWKGIPGKTIGGPCTFGQLTMCHSFRGNLPSSHKLVRDKWSTYTYRQNCDDSVESWNLGTRVFASVIPSIGTAHALKALNNLGYRLAN